MNNRIDTIARHGDILLKKTNDVVGKRTNNRTLALGEVTGHHHTLYGGVITSYEEKDEVKVLEVKKETSLEHQEHKPIKVAPGLYKVFRKIEHDPFGEAMRRVRD